MKNKDKEEMLLSDATLEDLIKMKMEKEFLEDLKKSKEKPKKQTYTEIKKAPKNMIFSKEAVYRYFNRDTKCETFINGVQAEAMIGIENYIREKLLKGELSAFTTENAYIKFDRVVC